MVRSKTWLLSSMAALSVGALLGSTSAKAADLPEFIPVAPVEKSFGGWYLRGDIGFSSQSVRKLDNALYNNPGTITAQGRTFDSAGIFGVGIGYQVNPWLRFDVTGEYRGQSNFKGADQVTFPSAGGTAIMTDNYTASKSEWVAMVNGYVDLGTWYGITPFVGAGLGAANVTIQGFRDDGLGFQPNGAPIISTAYGATRSQWNFAWAVHAGLAFQVTDCLTLELAYRYINLGSGITGDLVGVNGLNTVNNPMHFKDITSNDVKVGLRWYFSAPPAPPPGPLMRRG